MVGTTNLSLLPFFELRFVGKSGTSSYECISANKYGTELFYLRDLKTTTIEQFIQVVDFDIRWYNEKSIEIFLGSLSPLEYRESLGFTT